MILIFIHAEDDGEVFQVRKSSHSKKVMRMLDKERRKKKREERAEHTGLSGHPGYENGSTIQHLESSSATASGAGPANLSSRVQSKSKKCDNDMIQTEIRTDDFVVRLLLFNFPTKNNKQFFTIYVPNKYIKRIWSSLIYNRKNKPKISNTYNLGYVFGLIV